MMRSLVSWGISCAIGERFSTTEIVAGDRPRCLAKSLRFTGAGFLGSRPSDIRALPWTQKIYKIVTAAEEVRDEYFAARDEIVPSKIEGASNCSLLSSYPTTKDMRTN